MFKKFYFRESADVQKQKFFFRNYINLLGILDSSNDSFMTKGFPTEIFTFVSFIYRLGTQFLVGNHFDGCDHAIACVKYFTMG